MPDSPPAVPPQEATVLDTAAALQEAGYTLVFGVDDGRLASTDGSVADRPGAFEVLWAYRFEGESDPADESVIFALVHRPSGALGQFTTAYGPAMQHQDVLLALEGSHTAPPVRDE